MQTVEEGPQNTPELVPLNVIRVETALSRFPVHRLAKQGTANIEISERSENGELLIKWEVSHNSRFGQPGPLAYKLDTLIVNRRIEEAARPIPKIIKLGTLRDVCHELGISTGENLNTVKKALHQNASAYITAKLRYKLASGGTKDLEAGFNRYGVVFTGEELPDGRRADAVYLVLSDLFMQVLNGAQTRPLDYDYLKDLPPASQRVYELLSFHVYSALRNGRREAKFGYADFCTHAPLTRFQKWDQVRPQMARVHRPHLKSGYIESVSFEQTTDRDGKPDWVMAYVPGPKARAEYRAFNKRGGPRTLEIEQAPPALPEPTRAEPTPLERELIARGVAPATAAELVAEYPKEELAAQVEHFDWLKQKHPRKVKDSPAGFLVSAIRNGYATLPGFESTAQRATREETKREQQRRETEAARKRHEAKAAELEQKARVEAYLKALDPVALKQLDQEALEHVDPNSRAAYDQMTLATLKRAQLRIFREAHVRRILELPELA
jgi:hypothetical protein